MASSFRLAVRNGSSRLNCACTATRRIETSSLKPCGDTCARPPDLICLVFTLVMRHSHNDMLNPHRGFFVRFYYPSRDRKGPLAEARQGTFRQTHRTVAHAHLRARHLWKRSE